MGSEHSTDEGVRSAPLPRFNRFGQESQTGGWVKYEDHEKCVAGLRRQLEVLSARLKEANARMVEAEERCQSLMQIMGAHDSVKPASTRSTGDGPLKP
jgi:hypothetical protein